MMGILESLFLVGGLVAAAAVAVGCGVGLFVWLSGGRSDASTEAWRPADER